MLVEKKICFDMDGTIANLYAVEKVIRKEIEKL